MDGVSLPGLVIVRNGPVAGNRFWNRVEALLESSDIPK
jgi:hypothetical protein